VLDDSGLLFGTTSAGGAFNKGTVFEVSQVAGNWVLDTETSGLFIRGFSPSTSV
jgi:uncharacterized repeat protein (TIGR03803 family)